MIRPTQARIDLAALRTNIRRIRSAADPGARIMGVVKANCYGHGDFLCVPVMRQEGVGIFGVATVEEGVRLRDLGVTERVVVLGPPYPGQFDLYVQHELEPLISNIATAESLEAVAEATGRSIRVHAYVDTGMTRNGCEPAEALDILERMSSMPKLEVIGFASHLSTSDEVGHGFAREQVRIFDIALRRALDAGYFFEDIHIANSGGVFNVPGSHYTLVRPGLALYGYHPTVEHQAGSGLTPIMTLRTVVGGIKPVEQDVPVSYGRRYYTPAPTSIVTMPIGYADGLPRALSGNCDVLIDGLRHPVVGAVCMDETLVDIGGESVAAVGEEVILIGRSGSDSIDAWELARRAGTIPWEILTGISARVPRVAWTPSKTSDSTSGT